MATAVFDDVQLQAAFDTLEPLCSRCLGQLAAGVLPAALDGRAQRQTLDRLFVIGAALLTREMEQ